mmetsp:Transcript_6777/g.14156  ORF Transcript_6777/g.14156 Transcript_6777/m.14156 type:complete len:109 (+) Transcript_6777:272-598(+)
MHIVSRALQPIWEWKDSATHQELSRLLREPWLFTRVRSIIAWSSTMRTWQNCSKDTANTNSSKPSKFMLHASTDESKLWKTGGSNSMDVTLGERMDVALGECITVGRA